MMAKLAKKLMKKTQNITAEELLMLIGTRELTPAERKLYKDLKAKEK